MSRILKIVIGIVVVVVIVGVVGAGWFIARRGWPPRALAQRPAATHEVAVRLIDDNEDGVPDRGVVDLPAGPAGQNIEPGQGSDTRAGQLEVRLVDDNGDGIPDRGVIDRPARGAFDSAPGRNRPGGPGFALGRPRPFAGALFGPFLLIGGLIRGLISLAILALLVSLTIFFYRRWQPASPVAVVNAPPAPAEVQPTPADDQEEAS